MRLKLYLDKAKRLFCVLGGNVTIDDFKNYQTITHEDKYVIKLDENYRAYVPAPPSSGILIPFIMKVMKGIL